MKDEYPELTRITILENLLEICKQGREYSHSNNIILNKNLGLKFEEVDTLHAAIRKYFRCVQATNSCTEMLLSHHTSDEPAQLMQAMYVAQAELFKLAGIEYFGGHLESTSV